MGGAAGMREAGAVRYYRKSAADLALLDILDVLIKQATGQEKEKLQAHKDKLGKGVK